jgi:hypothetical protein
LGLGKGGSRSRVAREAVGYVTRILEDSSLLILDTRKIYLRKDLRNLLLIDYVVYS